MHHGDTKIAQLKVEEWLCAVSPPFPCKYTVDIGGFTDELTGVKQKDHYGNVLELYCLSILPRNEEWEFAKTFIEMNEYLSDSRKKVSLSLCGDLTLDISHKVGSPKSSSYKGERKADHFSSTANQLETYEISSKSTSHASWVFI